VNLPLHRITQTAAAFATLALLGIALTVAVTMASAADRPTNGGSAAPAPPDPEATLGVLGLDGRPIVGIDGGAVRLPLSELPPLPDNVGEALDPTAQPTELTLTRSLLEAHRQTLAAVADHERYGVVDQLDFYVRNGALVPADVGGDPTSELRTTLATAESQAAARQTAAACTSLATAAAGLDGQAPDLVGGLARPSLADTVARRQVELAC
jgi:hypothetical protein